MTGALPDLLERVAGDLRTGAAPQSAVAEAALGNLPPALAGDLTRLVERAREEGFSPAMDAWAGERPLPAVAAVAAALEIAVGAGGPAAPALEGLGAGLRDRSDAAAEVAALPPRPACRPSWSAPPRSSPSACRSSPTPGSPPPSSEPAPAGPAS